MINFDELFEKYLAKWYASHAEELTADEMEDKIPDVYEEWVTSPCKEAGGVTPEEYFEAITEPQALLDAFLESEKEGGACSLLLARITMVQECASGLADIIRKEKDEQTLVEAMNLLSEMNGDHPLDKYVEFVSDATAPESVVELASEILKDNASAVKDAVIDKIAAATDAQKEIYADILVEADKDERTYALLKELFQKGRNIPYIAGLIGKYGDERAAEFLYPALDDSNYLEFIEIRSAIENLGGVVDDTYRDFSDDEYYKAIKNLK